MELQGETYWISQENQYSNPKNGVGNFNYEYALATVGATLSKYSTPAGSSCKIGFNIAQRTDAPSMPELCKLQS